MMVVAHTFFSAYLVSVAGGVDPEVSVELHLHPGHRLHALPMFGAIAVVLLCALLRLLSKLYGVKPCRCRHHIYCGSCGIAVDDTATENLRSLLFSRAYKEGLIGNEDDECVLYYTIHLTVQALPRCT